MSVKSMALFCMQLAEDYLSGYQRSWDWLHGLSDGYPKDYLKGVLRSGECVREHTDGRLELLDQGRESVRRAFPLLSWRKQIWDRRWRVIMYDIPEQDRDKRDKLRYWLKKMGFGQWQISAWISPHPLVFALDEFLDRAGVVEYCGIYESKRIGGQTDRDFANKIWHIDELNAKYGEMLDSFDRNRVALYLDALSKDPMLPKELLPEDWLGTVLEKRILEI